MTSSLREVPLETTLSRARKLAAEIGITRVTDTTWLDYIGIPVYSSIRPGAAAGSLCVNAGKGVRPLEAKVGAYMEAIEFAMAEHRTGTVKTFVSTPREVVDQEHVSFSFVDLCPLLGNEVDPDGPLSCVEAEEVFTGHRVALPAELVFSPYPENPAQRIFGTSTNGLCSGNSVDEATVHGIAEVLERDVNAFNFIRDDSLFVELDEPNDDVENLLTKIAAAGLQGVVRYTPSAFGLPHFQGFILEPNDDAPIAIAHGSGLHPLRDIATVRALSEAAQSRLSYIHGGRDDLIERFRYFSQLDGQIEIQAAGQLRRRVTDTSRTINYSEIPTGPEDITDLPGALSHLANALRGQGIDQVFRVVLSSPDMDLAVVKVVVPKLESFEPELRRVGPRLARHLKTREAARV